MFSGDGAVGRFGRLLGWCAVGRVRTPLWGPAPAAPRSGLGRTQLDRTPQARRGSGRDAYAMCALWFGILALRHARGTVDAQAIRHSGTALQIRAALQGHGLDRHQRCRLYPRPSPHRCGGTPQPSGLAPREGVMIVGAGDAPIVLGRPGRSEIPRAANRGRSRAVYPFEGLPLLLPARQSIRDGMPCERQGAAPGPCGRASATCAKPCVAHDAGSSAEEFTRP
jgi:hypothetical protein